MESHDNFAYLLPFIMLTFGGTFIAMRRFGGAVGAGHWGFGYIFAALGFSTPLLLGGLPLPVQAILANAFFLAAFFLYGHALLVRFAQPTAFSARLVLAAMAFLGITFLILVKHDLLSELVFGDLACAALLIVPLWLVRRCLKRPIDKLLGAMVAMVVLDNTSRVVTMLAVSTSGDYASFDDFLGSDYAFYMQVNASIVGFLLALTVLGTVMLDVVARYRDAAERDPLTELLNRRGFEQALMNLWHGSLPVGAIVVGDIDHFKQVNDRFGHAAGDGVIAGVAEVLKRHFPTEAAIARFGGEEFVAFLPGKSLAEANVIANAARIGISARDWAENGVNQQITTSFGVSSTARGDHSVHDAIARADACLYAAKKAGRNQVVLEGKRPPDGPSLRVVI